MTKNPFKVAVASGAGLYFLWCAWEPSRWHLIDGVNLIIHEAGHFVFMPFGDFLGVAGGSLFQVIMPALFVGYFYRSGQLYSAALTLFWVGESTLNVSVYAGDAVKQQLPLLGGDGATHDWGYLLGRLGLLGATREIAGCLWLGGAATIALALYLTLKWSADEDRTGMAPVRPTR
jgi:hypothetical protein